MKRVISKYLKSTGGNFAIMFALGATPLFMAGALAIDYGVIYQKQSELQHAADVSALATTKELGVTSTKKADIPAIARNYVHAQFDAKTAADIVVDATIGSDNKSVSVDLAYTWQPFFAHYFDTSVLPLKASATAALAGTSESTSYCVIALGESSSAMAITGRATLNANGCAIQSNSTASNAISVNKFGNMQAVANFSSGGYSGSLSSITPAAITDSPKLGDPLIDRKLPTAGSCDYNNMEMYSGGTETLNPGTYCGGIFVMSGTDVVLNPGVYIMKDGPLDIVSGNLRGENVGIHFEGNKSFFDFVPTSTLSLTAPKTGPMAGILFSEDRSALLGRNFVMRSKNAERLEGVIYLPRGRLVVEKASRIGQVSKWTAIIAHEIEIRQGPELVLNSDYGGSSVPAPSGLTQTTSNKVSKIWLVN